MIATVYMSTKGLPFPSEERRQAHQQIVLVNAQRYQASRRAKLYGVPDTLTLAEWRQILVASKGVCAYCDEMVGIERLTIEHVKPLCKGGVNSIDNIAAVCKPCNCRKGSR